MVSGIAYGIGRYFIYDMIKYLPCNRSVAPLHLEFTTSGRNKEPSNPGLLELWSLWQTFFSYKAGNSTFSLKAYPLYLSCLAIIHLLNRPLVYQLRFSFSFPLHKLDFPFFFLLIRLFVCVYLVTKGLNSSILLVLHCDPVIELCNDLA